MTARRYEWLDCSSWEFARQAVELVSRTEASAIIGGQLGLGAWQLPECGHLYLVYVNGQFVDLRHSACEATRVIEEALDTPPPAHENITPLPMAAAGRPA